MWTIYSANSLRLFRIVPSQQSVSTVAAAMPGYYFIGSSFIPYIPPTPSVTPSTTPSNTPSNTGTPTSEWRGQRD